MHEKSYSGLIFNLSLHPHPTVSACPLAWTCSNPISWLSWDLNCIYYNSFKKKTLYLPPCVEPEGVHLFHRYDLISQRVSKRMLAILQRLTQNLEEMCSPGEALCLMQTASWCFVAGKNWMLAVAPSEPHSILAILCEGTILLGMKKSWKHGSSALHGVLSALCQPPGEKGMPIRGGSGRWSCCCLTLP